MNISVKNLFTAAALSALLAGVLLTLVQQFQVIPAIAEAETYEQGAAHSHSHSEGHSDGHAHGHDETAWAPQSGLQRTLLTAAANVVIALGFALLLGAGAALRDNTLNWRSGLLWGLAGYAIFFIAPTLGLAPELPGTAAADLQLRQYWWLATVICSGAGLALLVFNRRASIKLLGVLLIIAPHIFGAPQPEVAGALAPADLIQGFVIATVISNALFWLALGGLYGFFSQNLNQKCNQKPAS